MGVAQLSRVPVAVPVSVLNVVGIETSMDPVGGVVKQTVNGAAPKQTRASGGGVSGLASGGSWPTHWPAPPRSPKRRPDGHMLSGKLQKPLASQVPPGPHEGSPLQLNDSWR